jgi:hypothetical protein
MWSTAQRVDRVCHYRVTAGQLEFYPDCTHDLKGQTVAMPDIPEDE